MSYKHQDTANAVQNVKALHAMLATTNTELAGARRDLSDERYRAYEKQKRDAYDIARASAMESVRTMKRNLTAILDEQEARNLVEHGKNEYIQLIANGAKLTAHELALMLQKHPENPLLLRSVKDYAEKNNFTENAEYRKAFNVAQTAQNPEVTPRQCIDRLAEYLTRYAPKDSDFANPEGQKLSQSLFETLTSEKNHLFENFDNGI